MTPVDRGPNFTPSPQAVTIIRERLQQMGLSLSEAAARSLLQAVLAIEGPRLHLEVRGAFENSLEIIRDTAESALGGVIEKGVEGSDQLTGGPRPAEPRHPLESPEEGYDGDEPRPVFKRPRR